MLNQNLTKTKSGNLVKMRIKPEPHFPWSGSVRFSWVSPEEACVSTELCPKRDVCFCFNSIVTLNFKFIELQQLPSFRDIESPVCPPEELEEVSGERRVWESLLRLLPPWPGPVTWPRIREEDGWLWFYIHEARAGPRWLCLKPQTADDNKH